MNCLFNRLIDAFDLRFLSYCVHERHRPQNIKRNNFAIKNHIGKIKIEQLANIRSTTSKSRKNGKNKGYLHNWSFYRLARFIEYKAKLAGIKVEYVNPAYTSKRCPVCGAVNESDDRKYSCDCGYHNHRDIVGAINICASTEISGNRKSA